MAEHIEVDIPLDTKFASTVRAVAAAVTADLGFSVDEIDDLRLAVNEAVSVLANVVVEGRLTIRFEFDAATVTVRCARSGVADHLTIDDVDVLARRILDAVVDEYSVSDGAFTIVKRIAVAAN